MEEKSVPVQQEIGGCPPRKTKQPMKRKNPPGMGKRERDPVSSGGEYMKGKRVFKRDAMTGSLKERGKSQKEKTRLSEKEVPRLRRGEKSRWYSPEASDEDEVYAPPKRKGGAYTLEGWGGEKGSKKRIPQKDPKEKKKECTRKSNREMPPKKKEPKSGGRGKGTTARNRYE